MKTDLPSTSKETDPPRGPAEERWQQISELFAGAVQLPPEERRAYLLQRSPEDSHLVLEVERLLVADEKVRALVEERSISSSAAELSEPSPLPRDLGPYRILRLLGQGGMGAVYLAARADEEYERIVAIKVLRQDLTSEAALARFAIERQILAQLEHPNIARLYESGVTEQGQPYLVMEFVDGLPVDRYCDQHRLSIRERLELFQGICAAVSYAHANLLVHRDLKPSNILVDKEGRPVLLDFGIAKPLQPDGAEAHLVTRTGSRPMTPGYASPEQVKGEPITTASDVYSLGVLLYELLCGKGPYRRKSGFRRELEELICEQEAQRPSEALSRPPTDFESESDFADGSKAASDRASSLEALRSELRGDLDSIVLKALRKEPQRRYGSVERLAEDLVRHLRDEPVLARPATLRYRLGRFVKRKRWAVAATTVIVLLILASTVALSVQARRVALERDTAQQALSFLVDVFQASNPSRARGETLTAREILDQAVPRIQTELGDQPEIRATLLDSVGEVYSSLGFFDKATPLLEQSLEIRRRLYGSGHPAEASTLHHLASTARNRGDLDLSQQLFSEALDLRRKALGNNAPEVAATLNGLGDILRMQEDPSSAEEMHRQALQIYRRTTGAVSVEVAETLRALGELADDRGDDEAALALFEESLEAYRKEKGEDSLEAAESTLRVALSLNAQSRPEEAEPLLRWSLERMRNILPEDNRDILRGLNALALLLANKNQPEEAVSHLREAIEIHRKTPDRNRMELASCLNSLGMILFEMGSFSEAAPVHREALELRREIFGESNRYVAQSHYHLGNVHLGEKDFETATAHFERGLGIVQESLGPEHPHIGYYLLGLAKVSKELGEIPRAIDLFRQSWEALSAAMGDDHRVVAGVENRLGAALLEAGRYSEAEPHLLHSREVLITHWEEDDPRRERLLEKPLQELYRAWTPPAGPPESTP